jgi:predicted nucleic acid-binding protein
MTVCCDTSFLFSVYANDVHSGAALSELRRIGLAVHISVLNQYELENALRLATFRMLYSALTVQGFLAEFESDIAGGRLILATCNLASVVAEARRLSAVHTPKRGQRAFDVLHVAAALDLGANQFLSFDVNQRKMARAEGLQIGP